MIQDLLQQSFVQNAFLAGTIVAIVASLMGYFVVIRAQAFASDSLSHIAFAGATGGAIVGLSSLAGTFLLTLLSALGMGALGERVRERDVDTGMVLAFALGLGVLFLSLYATGTNANVTVSVLFGSLLSITRTNVWVTLIAAILVLLVLAVLFRPLLFASIDAEVALARGVPVRLLSILFLLLLAVTIAVSVQVVGALLIFALLIAPAATAQQWTRRPLTTLVLSVVLGLAFTWIGLILSFFALHWPVSFYIAALSALSYFVSLPFGRRRNVQRQEAVHCCHECMPTANTVVRD